MTDKNIVISNPINFYTQKLFPQSLPTNSILSVYLTDPRVQEFLKNRH